MLAGAKNGCLGDAILSDQLVHVELSADHLTFSMAKSELAAWRGWERAGSME
jgi:hypothetical protein